MFSHGCSEVSETSAYENRKPHLPKCISVTWYQSRRVVGVHGEYEFDEEVEGNWLGYMCKRVCEGSE
jgi:hypothetical protein